ncbi:AraC family transcriptional regulator [Maricurvus nonylphenolicus]|uniref:AraC family transcriptional regulator n=1 Tax=Maricurvus nonylphenolicus TaxID=1008307 RepID=UPI0036F2280B
MKPYLTANTWSNGLLNQLSQLGVSLERLASELPELDIQSIRQGQRINVTLLRQIWHKAEVLSGDPLLGYNVGKNLNLKGMGVLTPILMHSPTGRKSLEDIARYTSLISTAVKFELDDADPNYVVLKLIPIRSPIKESPQHIVSLMVQLSAMSRYMGVEKNAIEKLTLPKGIDVELLASIMRYGVECVDVPPYSIWFSVRNLDDDIPGSDAHLYQINKAYADELLLQQKSGVDVLESIKAIIVEQGYQRANTDKVADQLKLSKRRLQRILADEKSSFRQLKEEVVKERALLLIVRGELSVVEISKALGYSEVSAFHRAFKIWFGVTPKDYAQNPAIQLSVVASS